jgi:hypothetical protein
MAGLAPTLIARVKGKPQRKGSLLDGYYVEALYQGSVPCSAFVEFVVFREIQKWVTVPVGDDVLEMIEGQCRKWHAKDEAEYARHGSRARQPLHMPM